MTKLEQWAVELACAVQCEVDEIDAAKRILRAFEDRERKLREEIESLKAERRGIISHATMGHTTGDGMNLNAVAVEISRQRNKLYDAGKDAARIEALKETPDAQ